MFGCPHCGGHHLRSSRPRTLAEELKSLIGITPVRCIDCSTRFVTWLWGPATWFYAKCPRCYRMDLTTWSEGRYRPGFRDSLHLSLGGRRRRCEYCRCNFVSWRPVKRRSRRGGAEPSASEDPKRVSVTPAE